MRRKVQYALLAVLVIAVILLVSRLWALGSVETLRSAIEPFGILAPVAFGVIYIVAALSFVSVTVFTVAAGVLFGKTGGFFAAIIPATIAAAIAFLIGRRFSDLIPKAKSGGIRKLQDSLEAKLHANTFQTIAILRLLYLPYIALSYAAGLVKTAQFWPYVLATFLTNIVGSFVFVYLGDSLGKGIRALILPAILIILTLLIPRVVRRVTGRSESKKPL